MTSPVANQEALYKFPYHWFPEERLKKFERAEKQRLIFGLIDQHLNEPPHRYLDVGCGDGRWTSDIHYKLNRVPKTIGIDFSAQAIGFAELISPEIDFQIHTGKGIPFPSNYFDLVTAIEVIEHVEDGAEEEFLWELCRVLKKNGLLILTTPSWNLKLTHHHFRHYSIERLTDLLTTQGFAVLDIKGQSVPCYGIRRKIRKRMNLFPFIWKFWRYSFRETNPDKSLNLIVAARPIRKR